MIRTETNPQDIVMEDHHHHSSGHHGHHHTGHNGHHYVSKPSIDKDPQTGHTPEHDYNGVPLRSPVVREEADAPDQEEMLDVEQHPPAHPLQFHPSFNHSEELEKARKHHEHQMHTGIDYDAELAQLDSEEAMIPGLGN